MWRYLVGAVAGLLLVGGGVLWWRSSAVAERSAIPAAPVAAQDAPADDLAEPPVAGEKTREERRFSRYDKDKDGAVAREEYLAARRKAYAKLDVNGDGRLSFDEWAIKTTEKFAAADKDKSGILTPAEFATTRVVRKARAPVRCPPLVDGDAEPETITTELCRREAGCQKNCAYG